MSPGVDTLLAVMGNSERLHPSDSSVQRAAEKQILAALRRKLGLALDDDPVRTFGSIRVELDAFQDGDMPVCAEIWAHQGRSKDGQRKKLMRDMCKLLLVERLLQKPCRKIVAGSDRTAFAFLSNSWQGRFAVEFGVEAVVVEIDAALRESLCQTQRQQRR